MSIIKPRHVKGFACKTRGSVAASSYRNGTVYYAAGSILVASSEDDPTKQEFLRGHTDNISALAMSGNGKWIATGSCGRNADIVIWDTATHEEIFRFCEHDFQVNVLEFSPDGRLLLSIGNKKDEKCFVWDLRTGNIVARCLVPKAMNGDPQEITCGAWAPVAPGSKTYLAACAGTPDIFLLHIDPYKGDIQAEKVIPGTVVRHYTQAVFGEDGQFLFIGSTSGDVIGVNVMRKAVQTTHPICRLGVGAMLYVDGELLVGGGDGSITLLRTLEMRSSEVPRAMLPGGVTSLSRTADGSALIAGTATARIARVDLRNYDVSIISAAHEAAVVGVSYNNGFVATCSTDASIRIWNMDTLELVAQIQNPSKKGGVVPQCVYISDAQELLSGWSDGQLWCHDLYGNPIWNIHSCHISASGTGVSAVSMAHEGKFVATGGNNGDVRIWDKGSRELVAHLTQHKNVVCDIKVYNDDRHVISGSKDGTFVIWDVYQECRVSSHYCPTGGFTGLDLAADQVQVVTVGMDCKLQFWDVRHQTPLQVIDKSHMDVCTACTTNGACELVATSGADRGVRLWDFSSGAPLSGEQVHSGEVSKLAFGGDGDTTLISVGQDGFIVFWDVC